MTQKMSGKIQIYPFWALDPILELLYFRSKFQAGAKQFKSYLYGQ